jgi:hypothetical protein
MKAQTGLKAGGGYCHPCGYKPEINVSVNVQVDVGIGISL